MDSNKEHLYRRMLKECQDKASKDTIPVIDYLKTITPKNSIDYKLLEDPIYLNHSNRNDLIDKLKTLCKQKLKQITQINKTKSANTYRYDDFHMRKQVYIRLTTSEDEGYTHRIKRLVPHWLKELALLNNNKLRTVRKSFNQIKDMISCLFIQYNKVIVVRLDFFLSTDDKNKNNLEWLNKFFNSLQTSTLNSYKGYI
uniref:Inovirus Gp2 n=1 Tax=Myoviridae sp. ctLnO19 TaxID=2825085 RepID=A0A8S5P130_9CAUD|nr:MAG TPA: Inovirus Gp2 [Myoviridae sp. ctLnO19]DAJ69106.1 MAG TPA: Inovirus Gp2 [Caudoviricetes sp.]